MPISFYTHVCVWLCMLKKYMYICFSVLYIYQKKCICLYVCMYVCLCYIEGYLFIAFEKFEYIIDVDKLINVNFFWHIYYMYDFIMYLHGYLFIVFVFEKEECVLGVEKSTYFGMFLLPFFFFQEREYNKLKN